MKWGLLDKTYTMVLADISTVALVNFLWSESGVSFIACMYECVWLPVAVSIYEYFTASFVTKTGPQYKLQHYFSFCIYFKKATDHQ